MVSRALHCAVGALALLLVAGAVAPVAASPAPVSACPPCGYGFERATAAHGLDTEVRHGEATVRVHRNGSATWTARVVPTNESALARLAANESLARAVARDSFGRRYGSGIEHELVSTRVADGAFVIRYRTLDVVREGVAGSHVLTYFRDSPGAYVYTDLGADELTVVAPPGTTIARGFGDVDGRRMTATELPDAGEGPFVVVAPGETPSPGLVGALAVAVALADVIGRNLLLFVLVPGSVLVGGFAGIRRVAGPVDRLTPARLGGGVAVAGALALAGTLVAEADALPAVTGNLLAGGIGGAVLLALGGSVALPGARDRLTPTRLVGGGIVVAALAAVVSTDAIGVSTLHTSLALGVAALPAAVALGWLDARDDDRAAVRARRLFAGLAAGAVAVLLATAPLVERGGALFLLVPILLTAAAVGIVVLAVPLYLLGAAAAPR
ncbi:MAG: hypothetical protein ABEI11_01630 [Haloarculaceae archaeon]